MVPVMADQSTERRMGAFAHMSDIDALALAADLLEMLAERCNTATVQCPTCGATKRSDWDSWEISRKLLHMTEKLRAVADRIKCGSLRNPPPRAKQQLPEPAELA